MSKNKDIVEPQSNETVRVCIRCRPMNATEQQQGHSQAVETTPRGEIFVQKPFTNEAPKQFTFDMCYDNRATQEEIYANTAAPIIQNVLEGYNGTIFAYG